MRPKKHETTEASDLFRARLDQIINMKHELVQLAGKLDWEWLDGEIAPLYSDKGRPGIKTRFVIGLLLLKGRRSSVPSGQTRGKIGARMPRAQFDGPPGRRVFDGQRTMQAASAPQPPTRGIINLRHGNLGGAQSADFGVV